MVEVTSGFKTSGRLEIPELYYLGIPPGQGLVEVTGAGCLDPANSDLLKTTLK